MGQLFQNKHIDQLTGIGIWWEFRNYAVFVKMVNQQMQN